MRSLDVHFRARPQFTQVDGKAYAACYLASEEWTGQVDSSVHARQSKLFTAVAGAEGADSLLPAEAVAEGRRAAFAIYACLQEQIQPG